MIATTETIDNIIQEFEEGKREKRVWDNHWQLVGEFIFTRKAMFTQSVSQAEFLNDDLFDSTGPQALETMSSSLIGALWPNGARSIKLEPPRDIDGFDLQNKEYYEQITEILVEAMDDPKAGLMTSLEEYMLDQGAFGTSGIAVLSGDEELGTDLLYQAWDVKHMVIQEGRRGNIDVTFNERELTLRQAVLEYGFTSMPAEYQDMINQNSQNLRKKIKILHAIRPREEFNTDSFGSLDMPYMSIHIEMKHKKVLRESGFEEFPAMIARFSKRIGEVYGRSPGMKALPDIMELNAIWEGLTLAIEKQLEPPLAVLDDGSLGNGDIDVGPGAINVVRVNGRIGDKNPIQPIYTVGNIQEVEPLVTKLENSIMNRFSIDRLLDLNNENEMTLGEARIRNQLRAATLRSLFARQISELFTPLIERSVNILFRKGRLGVVPGSPQEAELIAQGITPLYIPEQVLRNISEGRDIYKIKYFTPAMRIMQSEEADGIIQTWDFITTHAGTAPSMKDGINEDESLRILSINLGCPREALNAKDVIDKIRKDRADMAEKQMQMEQARQASETARNAKQAELI